MVENIINKKLREIKEKPILYINIIMLTLISLIFINIIFKLDKNMTYTGVALVFIKSFNSILSILALGSCLISYCRLKNDSVFIKLPKRIFFEIKRSLCALKILFPSILAVVGVGGIIYIAYL